MRATDSTCSRPTSPRRLLDELREEARRRDATLDADREASRLLEADSKANRPALDADEEGDEFADAATASDPCWQVRRSPPR